ncbi:MAG: cupin domain-containing protein [Bacteroidota bacterium]
MIKELIDRLQLISHPEGGYYRELYRSEQKVTAPGRMGELSAVTTIYYMLVNGQISRFHRISADEIWHFYGGDPLELHIYDAENKKMSSQILDSRTMVCVVPGGCWQAAHPLGEYTLCGCTVAPGFEFSDFSFMKDEGLIAEVRSVYPELEDMV